jgi:hypothetical protein
MRWLARGTSQTHRAALLALYNLSTVARSLGLCHRSKAAIGTGPWETSALVRLFDGGRLIDVAAAVSPHAVLDAWAEQVTSTDRDIP